MEKIVDFFISWLVAVKDFLLAMPGDIWYAGLLIGFLCAVAGWGYNIIDTPKVFLKISGWGNSVALLTAIGTGVYILVQFCVLNFLNYIIMLNAGMFICKILYMFFAVFDRFGSVLDILLNIAAGPLAALTGWLLYKKELLLHIDSIADKIFR